MKKKITWLLAAAFTGIVVFSGVCQADGMSVDKEDGEYSIQVDLEGGSGKKTVSHMPRFSGAVPIMIT